MIEQGKQGTVHATEQEIVGYWKLHGDCRDYSGYDNHGINHSVNLDSGVFSGNGAYIEVPSSASLTLGTDNFTLSTGKLYVGFPSVYAFDGEQWTYAGVPSPPEETLQTHSFAVYQGSLCAGTWPSAKVAQYLGGEAWQDLGRVGEDGTEVNSLVVYNGKLYGGSIPRAEVCRYDGDGQWTSLTRFHSPPNWQPVLPVGMGGNPTRQQVCEWTRVTSMTIYRGKLFASIGSCTSAIIDTPADVRGKVYNLEAGKCASYDDELAPGWRHLVAVRGGNNLKLYVDGKCVATSTAFHPSDYDISTNQPLRIGAGQTAFFSGKISDVCLYRRALGDVEIERLSSNKS